MKKHETSAAIPSTPTLMDCFIKPKALEAIRGARDLPFASNGEYFELLKTIFFLRSARQKIEEMHELTLIDPKMALAEKISRGGLKEKLSALLSELEVIHSRRVAASRAAGSPVRVLRLQERLGLADDEIQTLNLCLLFNSEINVLVDYFKNQVELEDLLRVLGISSERCFAITAGDGILVSERLISIDEHHSGNGIKMELRVNRDALNALRGFRISREDYFKIAGTPLGEILRAEPDFPFAESGPEKNVPVASARRTSPKQLLRKRGKPGRTPSDANRIKNNK